MFWIYLICERYICFLSFQAEDDYNLSLIDGYESYNESNSSDTEHYAEAIVQPKVQAMSPEEKPVSQEKLSPIRFINGKDGMGMFLPLNIHKFICCHDVHEYDKN